jgi:hypothetical protein
MTDEERMNELAEEPVEDLEAPAAEQADVAGGVVHCLPPTCHGESDIGQLCVNSTCAATKTSCQLDTGTIVVRAF